MSKRIKFIEVNYHYHGEFRHPGEAIRLHASSNLFAGALLSEADAVLVKHIDGELQIRQGGLRFAFFRTKRRFTYVPLRTHRFIRGEDPDLVLVQGLIFPLQVIALRLRLGHRCTVLLQHHGEVPFRRKRILQRIADRFVDGYLFTSLGNAQEWQKAGIIKNTEKCFEMPSSSTLFRKKDKSVCKERKGLQGNFNFLWVGRLNDNKDPLTVVTAFARYIAINPLARLYMIYQEEELLPMLMEIKRSDALLEKGLILLGKMDHLALEDWYNAADYFISGSHREGGSYALTEAMACGCIPVVTSIPASMKAIGNGRAGHAYPPGDDAALFLLLKTLTEEDQQRRSPIVLQYFSEELSPQAIAKKLLAIYRALPAK